MLEYFKFKAEKFHAGQIAKHLASWRTITSDSEVLESVSGQHIEFSSLPVSTCSFSKTVAKPGEFNTFESEICKLLKKGVIVPSVNEKIQFVSPIFLRLKKDGTFRLILNLKDFNKHVEYHHFKMDSIRTVIGLMTQNCYMASVDLKDAYYSVPIASSDQKFLKFEWNSTIYQYTCFPNGLAFCPRKFTKLLKPVYASLRQLGHVSSPYIDDSWLMGRDYFTCVQNVIETVKLFNELGFVVHPNKSVLIPTQIIEFLGFILNSITMRVYLNSQKVNKLLTEAKTLLRCVNPVIRDVARVIGILISSFPGVQHGPLHFRCLEMNKITALKVNNGDFDAHMSLSDEAKSELQWWISSVDTAYCCISRGNADIIISSDASKTGWGGMVNGVPTGGFWTEAETAKHINYLEMLAVFLNLKSFQSLLDDKHVKVLVDNTTVKSILSNMGTCHSPQLNNLAVDIWNWCITRKIWLSVAHIAGKDNSAADIESRKEHHSIEWCLNKIIFQNICQQLDVMPNIDLFASRINFQVKPYVSFRPDPGSYAVDAFLISWSDYLFYAFPPFSLITKVLQKILLDKATGILVVPKWSTQPWWPRLMEMLIQPPLLLPQSKSVLFLPNKLEKVHPLYPKLQLLACHLSGNYLKTMLYQQQQQILLNSHGELQLDHSTKSILRNGKGTVVQGILVPFHPLLVKE